MRRPVLPAAPTPCAGESFSGWLGRVSALYAATPARFLHAIGAPQTKSDADRPNASLLAVLRCATGVPGAQIRRTVLHVAPAPDTPPPGVSPRRRGARWLAGMPLYEEVRRWCPCCLGDDSAFWPLSWRLGAPICTRHGVWLERRCPGCGFEQGFRPPAPSAICDRCASPYAVAPSKPFPASITEALLLIDQGLARLAFRGEARPCWKYVAPDREALVWRRLQVFALQTDGEHGAGFCDERDRLAALLEAAIAAGVLVAPAPEFAPEPPCATSPAPCASPTEGAQPSATRATQPSLTAGIAERVDAAIAMALGRLSARHVAITSKALWREADRILRASPDPARAQPVHRYARRPDAPRRQSTG